MPYRRRSSGSVTSAGGRRAVEHPSWRSSWQEQGVPSPPAAATAAWRSLPSSASRAALRVAAGGHAIARLYHPPRGSQGRRRGAGVARRDRAALGVPDRFPGRRRLTSPDRAIIGPRLTSQRVFPKAGRAPAAAPELRPGRTGRARMNPQRARSSTLHNHTSSPSSTGPAGSGMVEAALRHRQPAVAITDTEDLFGRWSSTGRPSPRGSSRFLGWRSTWAPRSRFREAGSPGDPHPRRVRLPPDPAGRERTRANRNLVQLVSKATWKGLPPPARGP